jgi:ATP-binding cassette, subfamily A (ABC1), member 3
MNLINKPLKYVNPNWINPFNLRSDFGFNLSFNIGFVLSIVTAMFVMFYIKERVSRAKLLQFVSGVNKVVFWMTSFIIDYAHFILISLVFLLTLAVFQKEGYNTFEELARNFLLLLVFGFAVLPYTYLWSFFFKIPSNGVVLLAIGYIVSGVFLFLTYIVLKNPKLGLKHLAETLGQCFLIFPHYSLIRGMSNLKELQKSWDICDQKCSFISECANVGLQSICKRTDLNCGNITNAIESIFCPFKDSCCDKSFYSFEEHGIGKNLMAMTLGGFVSFLLLFTVEYEWFQNIFHMICKQER